MLLNIPAVIDPKQLSVITEALQHASFIDGKLSAGSVARTVKNNQEMDQRTEIATHLSKIVVGSLYHSATFRHAALVLRISTPYFARYTAGMGYGDHIDDPIMGGNDARFRCDVAVTVFLNGPECYTGGELVINTSFGPSEVKLNAGDAVVYPASSLHHVNKVTSGERLVAVTWVQSLVRDPAKRELLFELNMARETLLSKEAGGATATQVDHAYVNLLRMWSEV